MPWKEYTMEKSRMEFLQEALTCEKSFKEICQDYGISRKTGYKWVDRYKSGEDLTNLSTRPLKSPNKISPEMENLIKSIREKHPGLDNYNIGYNASAYGFGNSVSIGYNASATSNSIQIGTGTNSTANSLQFWNYPLLDKTTGLIPDARISTNIARTTDIPTATSDLTNDSGFITSSDLPTNYVTTDTDQNITGTKTFVGQKKIAFKQSGTSDKLGFTLYSNTNVEKGYLEYGCKNSI